MRVDVIRTVPVSDSGRARQLESMFDVPRAKTSKSEWHGDVDFDAQPWNVGLIVGPSGTGKSTLLNEVFGAPREFEWAGASVVDDFDPALSMEDVSAACQAVGFNTIPSWLRPHSVLSTGEQFRVELARRLLECADPIVIDEFTSVVDRQVAQIGSHAVQKHVRRLERKLVVASCHYDIIDWLQPDWILEPATMAMQWRRLRPRPSLDVTISPVAYSAWRLFAPFHYLTAELNKAARCFVLFVGDRPAAFAGVLHFPHPKIKNIKRISRVVTLPDWQGLGLAFVLLERLGAAYRAKGMRLRNYPAHPAFVRAHDQSQQWAMTKRPGRYGPRAGPSSSVTRSWKQAQRPNAVFEYVGPADPEALILL